MLGMLTAKEQELELEAAPQQSPVRAEAAAELPGTSLPACGGQCISFASILRLGHATTGIQEPCSALKTSLAHNYKEVLLLLSVATAPAPQTSMNVASEAGALG